MTKWKIYNEDVLEWAKTYGKGPFHALLCDPPYHLTTITKRFGKKGSAPAKFGTDGVFARSSAGFMGQQWDGGDIAFRPETWASFLPLLHDGAFGMAFSASRNWHRLAVAIEDAGFIIHPTIFGWLNGQGFPKATRIDKKADDKAWEGHRYGLQALKPAVEPIIVFQKPYSGSPLGNITKSGAGAINIDGSRIALAGENDEYTINTFDDGAKPFGGGAGHEYSSRKVSMKEDKRLGGNGSWKTDKAAKIIYEGGYTGEDVESSPLGRWPANFIQDEESAELLDEQTGNGTSRFFYVVSNQIDESDPIYYCSKASSKEREAGLDDLPEKIFAQSGGAQSKAKQGEDEYKQDSIGINRISKRKNIHPTVKPIELARYLATMLLPPEKYAPRRILVPFSGSGSEMIGCALAGWEQIVGVELDKENGYIEIAEKRLEYWTREER